MRGRRTTLGALGLLGRASINPLTITERSVTKGQ
jgi:hypothetical protein